jgi:methyl-accepting chemotaxis protein
VPNINFAIVKMTHQTWRLKLRAYLNGTEEVDPRTLVTHRDCGLGKWIYSGETVSFASLPDFIELERKHKLMHQLVKEVVDLKRVGRLKEAQEGFLRVKEEADSVLLLISKVEEQVTRN